MKKLSILFTIVAFSLISCEEKRILIRYEADGDNMDITLSNPQGGTEQYNDRTNFYYEWEQDASAEVFKYISAQNNLNYGNVHVEILVDGVVQKQSNCSGAYCIATASD